MLRDRLQSASVRLAPEVVPVDVAARGSAGQADAPGDRGQVCNGDQIVVLVTSYIQSGAAG